MKTQRISTPKFSGYPLRPVDHLIPQQQKLSVAVKNAIKNQEKSLPEITSVSSDPAQWDESWFSSYE